MRNTKAILFNLKRQTFRIINLKLEIKPINKINYRYLIINTYDINGLAIIKISKYGNIISITNEDLVFIKNIVNNNRILTKKQLNLLLNKK